MPNETVEHIKANDELLAIVVRSGYDDKGINFITPQDLVLQFGMHNREAGEESKAHKHFNIPELSDIPVLEVFYIIEGKAKVNFFDDDSNVLKSVVLERGDSLINTGTRTHSVDYMEKTKMLEIKQGPYRGKEKDKSIRT
ncbi:MAG: hypothetical protein HYW24_01635 [Candidatus Aenigmarchaeota archaeon]|nr:hypothetical protein [Candidatus Aenigmarchaeota archaeon]